MNIPFFNDIDLKNNKIINVSNPVGDNDVATKIFVDDSIKTLQNNINADMLVQNNELKSYVDTQISNISTDISPLVQELLIANIEDNLSSIDSTKSLSANMGKVLSDNINSMYDTIDELSIKSSEIYSNDTELVNIGTYLDKTLYRYFYYIDDIMPSSSYEGNSWGFACKSYEFDFQIIDYSVIFYWENDDTHEVYKLQHYTNNNQPHDLAWITSVTTATIDTKHRIDVRLYMSNELRAIINKGKLRCSAVFKIVEI